MSNFGATFWSFATMQQYIAAIPYTKNGQASGPYIWSNQGTGSQFSRPNGSPGMRVGAIVGQFLFLGDLYQTQQPTLFIGDGSTATYSGVLAAPMSSTGQILDQQGTISGTFSNGTVTGTGVSGTINYATGAINLTFSPTPAIGDQIFAQYTQVAPYRCQWSAIGNPISWPTPLTQAALAAQSGFNDLAKEQGPVMFIAGYPLYGLIFQTYGITRASYIGGAVVFSWQPYEFKRGVVAHGAAVQVGQYVYFLADDGFYVTDGANVLPIGTATDNSAGIDRWFWTNVNTSALESIRAAYDSAKRCVFFAIPTGSNTLPDTLLIYNVLAQRWTRAGQPSEALWTADNGTDGNPGTSQILGLVDQTHTPNFLIGSPPFTGYLESCDLAYADGERRVTVGARPQVNAATPPLITIGTRNSLQDAVQYGTGTFPDTFSRVSPLLQGGIYTRVRAQSDSASSIHGAILFQETDGSI